LPCLDFQIEALHSGEFTVIFSELDELDHVNSVGFVDGRFSADERASKSNCIIVQNAFTRFPGGNWRSIPEMRSISRIEMNGSPKDLGSHHRIVLARGTLETSSNWERRTRRVGSLLLLPRRTD
ncbi:MAG: hypothetical protein ACK5PZ_09325, partial [Pirellula sp.]